MNKLMASTAMRSTPTVDDYDLAFCNECRQSYPVIDALEAEMGFAVDREKLEEAARVLACPVKVNPPNWQHGRVIYAVLRNHLTNIHEERKFIRCLDIGTAKGFSALCATWAGIDAGKNLLISSVDVIDPNARVMRNSVADCGGPKTLHEMLAPWPEARLVEFKQATGVNWLMLNRSPVEFAFIDGKHNYQAVREEVQLLRTCQHPGSLILFDDVQIPGVYKAVSEVEDYDVRMIEAKPDRRYALARKL